MNKGSVQRNEFVHLYNPKKEGWTSYDINYTNAMKKKRAIKAGTSICKKQDEWYAA